MPNATHTADRPATRPALTPVAAPTLRRLGSPRGGQFLARPAQGATSNQPRQEMVRVGVSDVLPVVGRPTLRRRTNGGAITTATGTATVAPTAATPVTAPQPLARVDREPPSGGDRMEPSLRLEVATLLKELESSFQRLQRDPGLIDAWQYSRRIFHTLQGTLATCGWLTWAIPAERAELECARAVIEAPRRTRETLGLCVRDADELWQALAAALPSDPGPSPSLAPASAHPPSSPTPAANRQRHVLVVDDSRSVRRFEMRLLRGWGYEVTTAVDGLDALEKLKHIAPVDLILTDVEMPRLDGLQLLRRLKEDPQWQRIPSAVISSSGTAEIRTKTAALGAREFLPKPFTEAQFQSLVKNHLLPDQRPAAPGSLQPVYRVT